MKYLYFSFLAFLCAMLSSCELAGSIFKGGVWTGVIIVVLVLVAIIYLVTRGRK